MRLLLIALVLSLLTGCILLPGEIIVIYPYTSPRSAEISGTLLDKNTHSPVSGADVYFACEAKLHTITDNAGRFQIKATRNHHWITEGGPGGSVRQSGPGFPSDIVITHTNWATQEISWDPTNNTILLEKLAAPSDPRLWLTFDANGTILQDGGGERYLGQKPVEFGKFSDGKLVVIKISFQQKVYMPRLIQLRGPNKSSFSITKESSSRWGFWPSFDQRPILNRTNGSSFVYRLEFFR